MSTDVSGNQAARGSGYCPCCGCLTLPEGMPGSYERCPVCHCLDDPVRFTDVEYVTEANEVSLREA